MSSALLEQEGLVGDSPLCKTADIDVIVPEFNELSRRPERFDAQVAYFSKISRKFNVILVDDASTDGSWERLVELNAQSGGKLHLFRMEQNGQKVQAIKRAVEMSRAEFVLLTDFDSTVMNPGRVRRALRKFRSNPKVGSVSLRLMPEGRSLFSMLQDLEYAIGRAVFCRYLLMQNRLRCVSGAAGLWRRRALQDALREHSGRHNGDDFEATAIAMRKGYAMAYEKSVVVETFVPQNPRDFYRQRRRWELGALETYDKEKRFYFEQIRTLHSKLGHVTIFDWYTWLTALTLPLFIVNGLLNHSVFELYMLVQGALTASAGYLSRDEIRDRKELLLLPIFPFYTLFAVIPRLSAMYQFLRGRRSRPSMPPIPWSAESSTGSPTSNRQRTGFRKSRNVASEHRSGCEGCR